MLASSVPAITLFLAYGGSFTATNLASRMQSGDYVNEKLAAPDVLEPGPVTRMAPEFQQDPVQGLTRTGAEQVLPTFNLAREAGLNETAAQRRVVEASTSYMQTLSQGLSHAYSVRIHGLHFAHVG